MPKVTCPKCGGDAECSHVYGETDSSRQSGQLFDTFFLKCPSCGHEASKSAYAGNVSSDGQVSNEQDNLCPYCKGKTAGDFAFVG